MNTVTRELIRKEMVKVNHAKSELIRKLDRLARQIEKQIGDCDVRLTELENSLEEEG